MEVKNKINEEFKIALKAKDALRLEVIRAIKTAFTNLEKLGTELKEADYVQTLRSLVKQRINTAEIYQTNNALEEAVKERKEAKIIETFLPQSLTEAEVLELINKVAVKEDLLIIKPNMGKLVKLVVEASSGCTDGKMVSTLIQQIIAS